jgi:hypothetical protein
LKYPTTGPHLMPDLQRREWHAANKKAFLPP